MGYLEIGKTITKANYTPWYILTGSTECCHQRKNTTTDKEKGAFQSIQIMCAQFSGQNDII